MKIKPLRELSDKIKEAEKAMQDELERRFPVGTTVRAYIMQGQSTPSVGDVICHPGGAHALIRLRLHSRTHHVRDVSAWNIR